MSSHQEASSERTPLLANDGAAEVNGDTRDDSNKSALEEIESWIARHLREVVLSLLLALFFVLALVNFTTRLPKDHSQPPALPSDQICNTPECVLASSTLLRSISPRYKELDPCEDFRNYACEGFDAVHEIRADQSGVGSFQLMGEEGELVLKRILESPAPKAISLFWTASSPDQEIFAKIQDSYSACANESRLKDLGAAPLIDLLSDLGRIYPVDLPPASKNNTLTNAVEYLISIGVSTPVSIYVGADDKDPDSNVLTLSPPYSFGLPSKQYYGRKDLVASYKDTIGSVLEALIKKAHPKHAALSTFEMPQAPGVLNRKTVDAVVDFESQLANAAPDPEDLSDITKIYNPRTVDEAEAYNPAISVKSIIDYFTHGYKPSKIIVASPSYLKSLAGILATEKREVIQAYLAWKVVQSYGTSVEDEAVVPLRRFYNTLQGKEADAKPERWRTCVNVVDSDFPWILSRFFVERAFSKKAKDLGDQIIYDIKYTFSNKLADAKWMTKSVRELAIDKVNLIRQKIGYPTKSPDVTDANELQQYYSNVTVTADAYFANRLSSTQDGVRRSWAQINKPVDKDEWGMSASTVNAYYNPPGNEIVFPAGIMQSPVFYDPSVPSYLSYGAFGAVAGHELSHAFDSLGRNYDPNGNYTDWWDGPTIKAFKERTDCFVEQFSNYSIPTKDGPLYVNGKLTLGENIADAGGLTAAFQSWKRRSAEIPDQFLPGLSAFSKEQIFFLAYGLMWCSKMREESAVQRIYTDPHSPNLYRIQGTTANSREFREAFNCPVKQPTCELW